MDATSLDLKMLAESEILTPIKDLKEVQTRASDFHVTRIDSSLCGVEDEDLVALLRINVVWFT